MGISSPAVFLDRDGTVNQDLGYLNDPNKVKLLPGAAKAIRLLNKRGFKVVIVSNQSGVARGLLSEGTVREINHRIEQELAKRGAFVDAVYFCPHHPEIGTPPYRKTCGCRKPEPGLLLQAAKDHQIDLSMSYMVGDEIRDVETGIRAGCKTVLVLTGDEIEIPNEGWNPRPGHVAGNLYQAARWILAEGEPKL